MSIEYSRLIRGLDSAESEASSPILGCPLVNITTRRGDDGTTGLFHGGRVAKDAPQPRAGGAVDEAQAAVGLARAECGALGLQDDLAAIGHELYVLMAELATLPENRSKLVPGQSLVTQEMVDAVEARMAAVAGRFEPPKAFVVPGANREAAVLDLARTLVRRAEREAVGVVVAGSLVIPYLNRLSDLLWVYARYAEAELGEG
jgi:cob(I)alamin adenosyltransferase